MANAYAAGFGQLMFFYGTSQPKNLILGSVGAVQRELKSIEANEP
jgi:hypothetical protein